jgi:hypothetical protein
MRAKGEDTMKSDHFFDGGKLIGSFVLVALIGWALENFAGMAFGASFGNTVAVFLAVIATGALRLLWMWVERSNVTLPLGGKPRRLTVGSLFVGAGAFLAVSYMFSGLAWLAAPSSQDVSGYESAPSAGGRLTDDFDRRQRARDRKEYAEKERTRQDRAWRMDNGLNPYDRYGNKLRCNGSPLKRECES